MPFKQGFGPELICLFVALSARRTDARPLSPIEHSHLDRGGVGIQTHHTTECIDLTNHLPFGLAADGRVARHLRHGIEILREEKRFAPESRRRRSGLDACVTGADNDHVIRFGMGEHGEFYVEQVGRSRMPVVARGNNCPRSDINISPRRFVEQIARVGANSAKTCRHAPQGEIGSRESATIAIRINDRSPAVIAAVTAARSAQMVNPKERFSTLHPVKIRPFAQSNAAPTLKPE